MLNVECMQCGGDVIFETIPEMGEKVACPHCHVRLEVVWLYPLDLDFDENPAVQAIASIEEERPK